jgi:hypothetical protein
MIKVNCKVCNKGLKELGALIFSPPPFDSNKVEKSHICYSCYVKFINFPT